MPETNKERLIFLLMMSAAMTIGMESYNLILMHASGAHLLKAIAIDFPLMMITVMITQRFVAGPAAMRLAQSFLPEKPSPFRRMVTVSTCTVLPRRHALLQAGTRLHPIRLARHFPAQSANGVLLANACGGTACQKVVPSLFQVTCPNRHHTECNYNSIFYANGLRPISFSVLTRTFFRSSSRIAPSIGVTS